MKKALLFFTAILSFGIAKAQTTCTGEAPGLTAGSTSCVTFTYKGESVQYTTVRAADGNVWMQQNLGSSQIATSATDAASYGGYFQWGRWQDGHEISTSLTAPAPTPNDPSAISGGMAAFFTGTPFWWNSGAPSNTWQAESPVDANEINGCDPCKAALGNGWRLPTEAEWTAVVANENITNVASGFTSNLKLPVAGSRTTSGSFNFVGTRGYYWSSTASLTINNYGRYFYYSNAALNPNSGGPRGQGAAVRCILGDPPAPQPVQPTSLTLNVQNNASATITTNGGTLQLVTAVLPATASQEIVWNILSGNELITFDSSGLVTALNNGTVTIQATSTSTASVSATIAITITNQVVAPASLSISVAGSAAAEISTNAGTLQLTAAVLPANADQSVTWSITEGAEFASVGTDGLVTAITNGTVTVQAVSTVDATLSDTIEITITNQVILPQSIEISYEEDDSAIFYKDGTIQLYAKVLPEEASQEVTWTIIDGEGFASIDENGLVTGIEDGIATIQAVSVADNTIIETLEITVKNQNLESAAPYCQAAVQYDVEPITKVVFAGIDNATNAAVNASPGYESFVSISGTVIKGQTYTMTVQGNTVGTFAHDVRVFADWNQNGVFDMADEYYVSFVENSTGTDGVEATLEIEIPQDAVAGTTRLRVTKDLWNVYEEGEFDACTNAYYGQVEDYSLIVTNVAGLTDVNAAQFTLYPNPTSNVVLVQANQEIQSLQVYNLTGQLIATGTTKQVDLSNAQTGVYMVKIYFENGATATQKIIKK